MVVWSALVFAAVFCLNTNRSISLSLYVCYQMDLLCSSSVLPLNIRQLSVVQSPIVVSDRILICVPVPHMCLIHGPFSCPIQTQPHITPQRSVRNPFRFPHFQ